MVGGVEARKYGQIIKISLFPTANLTFPCSVEDELRVLVYTYPCKKVVCGGTNLLKISD